MIWQGHPSNKRINYKQIRIKQNKNIIYNSVYKLRFMTGIMGTNMAGDGNSPTHIYYVIICSDLKKVLRGKSSIYH